MWPGHGDVQLVLDGHQVPGLFTMSSARRPAAFVPLFACAGQGANGFLGEVRFRGSNGFLYRPHTNDRHKSHSLGMVKRRFVVGAVLAADRPAADGFEQLAFQRSDDDGL